MSFTVCKLHLDKLIKIPEVCDVAKGTPISFWPERCCGTLKCSVRSEGFLTYEQGRGGMGRWRDVGKLDMPQGSAAVTKREEWFHGYGHDKFK